MIDIVNRLRFDATRCEVQFSRGVASNIDAGADEIERLRKGIQDYLDGNFGPDLPTKHDTCPHKRFGWEDCGQCIDEHFTALLSNSNG